METTSKSSLVKFFAPKVPFIFKTALSHSLWLSSTSSKWDLRTELIVTILRQIMSETNQSISKLQHITTKDPGVKGKMWISKVSIVAPPEDDLRQALFSAIEALKEGDERFTSPDLKPVEGEWTGYRAKVGRDEPEPNISESEKYQRLMKETTSDLTVLYFHGGIYYLCDPVTHRRSTTRLAKMTGGRVFSVRYRLAPQNPFPAAILDALVAYLSLLYPPPGSLHEAVPASKIIFAGDSAGGNLSLTLLQTILQMRRAAGGSDDPEITFHGARVGVPVPAGVSLSSPWTDVTVSMPSHEENLRFDYLPAPSHSENREIKECTLWPSNPAREHIYCDGSALTHPLVSPIRARSWSGACPIYFSVGQELLADECKVLAQKVARDGVTVIWEQYEAMPHCFALVIPGLGAGTANFKAWAKFCNDAVSDASSGAGVTKILKSEGDWIAAKSLKRTPVDVRNLSDMTEEDVRTRTEASKVKLIKSAEKRLNGSKL